MDQTLHLPVHNDDTKTFWENAKPPSDFEETMEQIRTFVRIQTDMKRPIALVTSGGTTVPLERNTVRFLDNFSGGGRGAASTEYFIENSYAVIFLNRRRSLQPFERSVLVHSHNMLDYLSVEGSKITVAEEHQAQLKTAYEKYQSALKEHRLIKVSFTTVTEYVLLLRAISKELAPLGKNAIVYSAAAVSDYYIPLTAMAEHKIQSSFGPLVVKFEPVPKMLKFLCSLWAPEAFVITFKLETDPNLLPTKAQGALKSYGHQLVIANLLSDHKDKVIFFTKDGNQQVIEKTSQEKQQEVDLEKKIVEEIVKLHKSV